MVRRLRKARTVVIINETVAKKLWPGQDPIGRIAIAGGTEVRVIGVIADVQREQRGGRTGLANVFARDAIWSGWSPAGGADAAAAGCAGLERDDDAAADQSTGSQRPSFDLSRDLVDHAVSPRRFFVYLVDIFAGLGLLLASLGIYGVISYSVTQRTQEIGLRMALGASRWNVQSSVIWRTLRLVLLGMVVGLGVSLAASRLIAALLFGTAPSDPKTFGAVALVLLAVALLAGYLPAWRASRINPMIALRNN